MSKETRPIEVGHNRAPEIAKIHSQELESKCNSDHLKMKAEDKVYASLRCRVFQ